MVPCARARCFSCWGLLILRVGTWWGASPREGVGTTRGALRARGVSAAGACSFCGSAPGGGHPLEKVYVQRGVPCARVQKVIPTVQKVITRVQKVITRVQKVIPRVQKVIPAVQRVMATVQKVIHTVQKETPTV